MHKQASTPQLLINFELVILVQSTEGAHLIGAASCAVPKRPPSTVTPSEKRKEVLLCNLCR